MTLLHRKFSQYHQKQIPKNNLKNNTPIIYCALIRFIFAIKHRVLLSGMTGRKRSEKAAIFARSSRPSPHRSFLLLRCRQSRPHPTMAGPGLCVFFYMCIHIYTYYVYIFILCIYIYIYIYIYVYICIYIYNNYNISINYRNDKWWGQIRNKSFSNILINI